MIKLIPIGRKSAREDPTASRERQEAVIAAWAAHNPDVELLPMVWENSISGSSDWRNRGLGSVIERCISGEASGIIVENQDRLSREKLAQTAEVWETLKENRLRLVCVADGLDTKTGDQEMIFTIKAAIAREGAKQMARRTDAMKQSKIASGVYISAVVPFGYDRDPATKKLVPSSAAPIVRELFERRASGQSYTSLCRWLDEVAPGGITGKGWSKQALKRFFSNRAYLGEARQGEYVNRTAHPPIVDEVVFAAVHARFRRREASPAKHGDAALLAGLARCGVCGYAMSRATVDGRSVYRHRTGTTCPGSGMIMLAKLDAYVVDEAFARANGKLDAEAIDPSIERSGILVRREALEIEQASFQNPELLRALGPEVVLGAVARIEAELAELDEQLIALSGERLDFPARVDWDDLPVEAQHGALASVLRDVLIFKRPRGATVAERVEIIGLDEESPITRPARGRGDVKVEARVEAS